MARKKKILSKQERARQARNERSWKAYTRRRNEDKKKGYALKEKMKKKDFMQFLKNAEEAGLRDKALDVLRHTERKVEKSTANKLAKRLLEENKVQDMTKQQLSGKILGGKLIDKAMFNGNFYEALFFITDNPSSHEDYEYAEAIFY